MVGAGVGADRRYGATPERFHGDLIARFRPPPVAPAGRTGKRADRPRRLPGRRCGRNFPSRPYGGGSAQPAVENELPAERAGER